MINSSMESSQVVQSEIGAGPSDIILENSNVTKKTLVKIVRKSTNTLPNDNLTTADTPLLLGEKRPIILRKVKQLSFQERHEPRVPYEIQLPYRYLMEIHQWFQSLKLNTNQALFFSGPPGTGKTLAVKIFCRYYGYTIKEFNALDCRNKKLVENVILKMLDHKPIDSHLFRDRKYVIVIDELECMADKNSLNDIIKLLNVKKRKDTADISLPLIFISNDTTDKKINELKKHCLEVDFPRPNNELIWQLFIQLCIVEKITISNDPQIQPKVLSIVNNDYRRLLNFTEFLLDFLTDESANNSVLVKDGSSVNREIVLDLETVQTAGTIYGGKYIDYNIYQNAENLFMCNDLKESIRIYESDKSLLPMMVHENYSDLVSKKYHDKQHQLSASMKIINSIIQGDLIDKVMYNTQSWHYYRVHSLNSCYLPVYYSWFLDTKPEIKFTTTLGKHSLQSSNKKKFLMVLSNIGNGRCYSTNDLYYLGNIIRYHALNKNGDIEEIKKIMKTYNLSFDIIDRIIRFSKLGETGTIYTGKVKTTLKTALEAVKIGKSIVFNEVDD